MSQITTDAVNISLSLLAMLGLVLAGMVVFQIFTKFNDQSELLKNNKAVAHAMSGKFLGICIVLGMSAYTNDSIGVMALWFLVGYACMTIAYFILELVTTKIKVGKEIANGNESVGLFVKVVYIGTAILVSTLII